MANWKGRVRATATPDVRATRGDIYRLSYKRAQRAIKAGFYLEAIALIESMMADRLESILAIQSRQPVHFRTAAQAASALRHTHPYRDSLLLKDVSAWSNGRSRWLHEFAKVSEHDHLTWRARIADARDVAEAGLDLLKGVASASQQARRAVRRSRG